MGRESPHNNMAAHFKSVQQSLKGDSQTNIQMFPEDYKVAEPRRPLAANMFDLTPKTNVQYSSIDRTSVGQAKVSKTGQTTMDGFNKSGNQYDMTTQGGSIYQTSV